MWRHKIQIYSVTSLMRVCESKYGRLLHVNLMFINQIFGRLTGLEIQFFLVLPGARLGSKSNFVVAKLYVHVLRNENILIL